MPKRMNEPTKTLCFAGTGIVMLLLAGATYFVNQPAKRTDFELVGQTFFENFESSSQASSLEVVAVDPDSARMQDFRVEEQDGVWSIPSHFGYPAEASDRLAQTSSSLLGLTRESLVGRLAADHERFGVVDPLSDVALDPESTGKRITLKDGNDEVLVDLIIGKEAGEESLSAAELGFDNSNSKTSYYVRHPDEVQTYKVALDLELSTKFSDWIRPDLLNLEGAEVKRIDIDNYELIEEASPLGGASRMYKKQGDQMKFSRDTGFGPWTMAGLAEDGFDLDSAKIDAAVSTLDGLKIAGVRKKASFNDQPILNADFSVNQIPQEELQQNAQQYISARNQFLGELSDNGFNLTPVAENSQELTIVPNAGQMVVGRGDGVVYTLLFGNPVSGDENEIEIGSGSSDDSSTDDKPVDDASEDPDGASEKTDADNAAADPAAAENDAEQEAVKNRFLMIRVDFDEAMLADKPVAPEAPTEPEKPAAYVPAPAEESEAAAAEEDPQAADAGSDAKDADATTDDTEDEAKEAKKDDRPEAFVAYEQALAEYGQQKTQFEMQQAKFEDDTKQFDERVTEGEKLVSELNQRFGAWFYVISGDNLESLQLSKDDLVSAKEEPAAAKPPTGLPGLPTRPNIQLGTEPAQQPVIPEPEQGSAPKDAGDQSTEVPATEPPPATDPATGTELPSTNEPAPAIDPVASESTGGGGETEVPEAEKTNEGG